MFVIHFAYLVFTLQVNRVRASSRGYGYKQGMLNFYIFILCTFLWPQVFLYYEVFSTC